MVNNIKKSIAVAILFIAAAAQVYSQGGSNYSIIGFGDIYNNTNAFYQGLAGTSIAIPSEEAINTANPALLPFVSSTRLEIGYRFNQHYNKTENSSLWQNNGELTGAQAVFSVDTAIGLSFAAGIAPYSSVNYYIANALVTTANDTKVEGIGYYQGQGGISKAFAAGGVSINKYLSVGTSFTVYFGTINSLTQVNFSNTTNNSYFEKDDKFSGISYKIGLYSNPTPNLGIGVYYEKYSNWKYTEDIIYPSVYSTSSTLFTKNYDCEVPDQIGVGVSYKIEKFVLGADFVKQDFSKFKYNAGAIGSFSDAYSTSVGVSRLGNTSYSAGILDRITYNFGFAYSNLYYKAKGEQIKEYYGAIGFHIPVVGSTYLDASFNVGQRGTKDNGLIKETFCRCLFNFSIGESWFKPYKREY